ncbi:uncharacterized protein LOC131931885 [Physella acuta]|uniref:uncharacterized protein LOC131931885 n=1 Tax=Physella acuta TaxID=109671 RepID=UPI0027DC3760|nr:uncharacterized protein LOC131931885 [Physella acuta]
MFFISRTWPIRYAAAKDEAANYTFEEYDKYNAQFAYLVFTYCSFYFLIVGIPGNILTLVVLRRRRLRDSDLSLYLASQCIFNVISLLLYVIRYLPVGLQSSDVKTNYLTICSGYLFLSNCIIAIVCWHQVLLAIWRFLYHSVSIRPMYTGYEPPLAVLGTCLFCGFYEILITYFGSKRQDIFSGYSECLLDQAVWTKANYILVFVVPCACLVIFYLLWFIIHRRRDVDCKNIHGLVAFLVKTTNVIFLVTSLVAPTYYYLVFSRFDENTRQTRVYLGYFVSQSTIHMSFASNVLVYLTLSSAYRKELHHMFVGMFRRKSVLIVDEVDEEEEDMMDEVDKTIESVVGFNETKI